MKQGHCSPPFCFHIINGVILIPSDVIQSSQQSLESRTTVTPSHMCPRGTLNKPTRKTWMFQWLIKKIALTVDFPLNVCKCCVTPCMPFDGRSSTHRLPGTQNYFLSYQNIARCSLGVCRIRVGVESCRGPWITVSTLSGWPKSYLMT